MSELPNSIHLEVDASHDIRPHYPLIYESLSFVVRRVEWVKLVYNTQPMVGRFEWSAVKERKITNP